MQWQRFKLTSMCSWRNRLAERSARQPASAQRRIAGTSFSWSVTPSSTTGQFDALKTMIDGGELGEIRYVFMRRLNLGIVRNDVDALWNLAPHDLSILNYWIDRPVVHMSAVGHSYLQPGIADVVFAHLTYEGNISGHIQVSWLDPSKVRQATVVGSRRMLLYDDTSTDARIVVYDKGIDANDLSKNLGGFETFAQHQLTVRAGDAWLPRVDFNEPLLKRSTTSSQPSPRKGNRWQAVLPAWRSSSSSSACPPQ